MSQCLPVAYGNRDRYLPSEVSDVELAEADKWWCDSRTAACACLLLLCATRESLRQEREALCLLGALREVCDALGRSTGHDSMVWGCDLDPGNWGTQRTPPGVQLSMSLCHHSLREQSPPLCWTDLLTGAQLSVP